ncbi:MAG: hypothetical protein WCK95_27965 [Alphaproteobacteria bacterium]
MDISRDHFIAHFSITFDVQCLRHWPKRSREPPYHIATSLHQWIGISSGHVPLKVHEFHELVEPVIDELHRCTPKGMRPCSRDVAGRVYDALSAAGVEVTIRPPLHSHSTPSQ